MAGIALLQDFAHTRYARTGSNMLILYDHLITFGDEIELIWTGKWSFVTFLFLLNRYYLLAAVFFNSYVIYNNRVNDVVSTRYYDWEGWTELIILLLSQAILQIRTYALYLFNKRVLALMTTGYVAALGVSTYILIHSLRSIIVTAVPAGTGSFCLPTRVQGFYAFWIPILIFDCMLCTLTIYKGAREFQTTGSIIRRSQSIIGVLLRDSVFYLIAIAAIYLISVVFWASAPLALAEAPIGFAPAMSCILSNRVILNVRDTSRETLCKAQEAELEPV